MIERHSGDGKTYVHCVFNQDISWDLHWKIVFYISITVGFCILVYVEYIDVLE
jgi:hypothetical protein